MAATFSSASPFRLVTIVRVNLVRRLEMLSDNEDCDGLPPARRGRMSRPWSGHRSAREISGGAARDSMDQVARRRRARSRSPRSFWLFLPSFMSAASDFCLSVRRSGGRAGRRWVDAGSADFVGVLMAYSFCQILLGARHARRGFQVALRRDRNASRTSLLKIAGCSQAAKWPPASAWWK